MSNFVGQMMGRYQIVEQLGEGGMATVYKGYDTTLQRNVAIKVIKSDRTADASFRKRFEREARALAQLSHPHIVHINDFGEQGGLAYLVMDYMSGGTLKIKMGRPMHYQEAARLLIRHIEMKDKDQFEPTQETKVLKTKLIIRDSSTKKLVNKK